MMTVVLTMVLVMALVTRSCPPSAVAQGPVQGVHRLQQGKARATAMSFE